MLEQAELVRTIRRVAEERFPGLIDSVRVNREVDFDGDAILMVTIIINERRGKGLLDAGLASGLTGQLRLVLDGLGEQSFPVISFVSKSKAGDRNPEAA